MKNTDETTQQSVLSSPNIQTSEVYSNFDHAYDREVVAQLESDPGICAQHSAWNFCGYVWRTADGIWHDEILHYHVVTEVISGNTIEEVIHEANDKYGYE